MTDPPPILRVPALVPYLRCPDRRCNKPVLKMEPEERFRGILECPRSSCPQRWFVEPLEAGSVRYQLEDRYLDVGITSDIMRRFNLPDQIPTPMYLQMPIGGELWEDYVREPKGKARTLRLLHRIVESLHRRTA